jgi:hypothetical protein
MVYVARNPGRNMVATWGEGGGPLMFGCCTQHCSLDLRSDG